MATQLVRNVVKDSGQNPIANSQVRIYLVAGPAGAALDAGAEASIGTPHVPSTSRAGYWAASLQPNAGAGAITNPTGTYYRVVEPSGATWTIQLNGDVAPPVDGWWVGDPAILVQDPVSPPPVVAGVTSAQLTAAADGAQAAATAAAATDATTKANAAQANAQLFTTAQLGNYVAAPSASAANLGDVIGHDSGQTNGVRWFTTQEHVARALGWFIVTDSRWAGGAKVDGTTDDSAACAAASAAANTAGGGTVWYPSGTCVAGSIPAYSKVHHRGAGPGATTIKAPAGSNAPVFITDQFASLTGTNTTGGPYAWSVRDMTIDGNKASNLTGGNGLSIYGSNFTLDHLRIINCRGKGIYSEWTTNTSTSGGGLESRVSNVNVADAEQMAVQWLGPHDAIWHDVIASNCARASGDCLFDLSNVVLNGCHGWGSYHARTFILRTGCELHTSRSEGGTVSQVQILANDEIVSDCNIFQGQSGAAASSGIEIGDATHAPANYRITAKISECGNGSGGGALNFVNDGGQGNIDAQIYQSAGNVLVGTPNTSTAYRLACNGAATKPSHTHVWPSTVTPQFNGGVDVDGGSVRLRAASSNQFTAFLNANPYFALDALNKRVLLENSAVFRMFSDSLVTKTFEVDGATGIITLANGLKYIPGITGSPEGVYAAPIGSVATRADGGAGTTLYIKESGTGNTGWVAYGPSTATMDGVAAPLTAGNYYAPQGPTGTTFQIAAGVERGGLLVVGRACTLTSIGINITGAGATGAVLRLGLWKIPAGATATTANLLVDAGTVDGTVTGYAELTISQAVSVGDKLILTAACQGAPATGPTVSAATGAVPYFGASTGAVAATTAIVGTGTTGRTGALPSSLTLTPTGTIPRVLVKAAT